MNAGTCTTNPVSANPAHRGVVALGKRADLLLLDADPIADVANTRKIAAVVVGGCFVSRSELDQEMKALDERYARMRNDGAAGTH